MAEKPEQPASELEALQKELQAAADQSDKFAKELTKAKDITASQVQADNMQGASVKQLVAERLAMEQVKAAESKGEKMGKAAALKLIERQKSQSEA